MPIRAIPHALGGQINVDFLDEPSGRSLPDPKGAADLCFVPVVVALHPVARDELQAIRRHVARLQAAVTVAEDGDALSLLRIPQLGAFFLAVEEKAVLFDEMVAVTKSSNRRNFPSAFLPGHALKFIASE